jgi:hypothetical protein
MREGEKRYSLISLLAGTFIHIQRTQRRRVRAMVSSTIERPLAAVMPEAERLATELDTSTTPAPLR